MTARPRRRARLGLRSRFRVFWVFIVIGLGVMGYAGYAVTTWSGFNARSVGVEGNVHVSPHEILSRAGIPPDRNIWLIDRRAGERRVETIPRIGSARIHRAFPSNVTIVVTEREISACAATPRGAYAVDVSGRVLETTCPAGLVRYAWPAERAHKPGENLQDAQRLIRFAHDVTTLTAYRLTPARIGLDRYGGVETAQPSGLTIRFGGDEDLAEKAKLVDPILRAYGVKARRVRVLDLRSPGTPVAVFR